MKIQAGELATNSINIRSGLVSSKFHQTISLSNELGFGLSFVMTHKLTISCVLRSCLSHFLCLLTVICLPVIFLRATFMVTQFIEVDLAGRFCHLHPSFSSCTSESSTPTWRFSNSFNKTRTRSCPEMCVSKIAL